MDYPVEIIKREIKYVERYKRITISGPATLQALLQNPEKLEERGRKYFQIREELITEEKVRNGFKERMLSQMNKDYVYYSVLGQTSRGQSSSFGPKNEVSEDSRELSNPQTEKENSQAETMSEGDLKIFLEKNSSEIKSGLLGFGLGAVTGAGLYHMVKKYSENSEEKMVEGVSKKVVEKLGVDYETSMGSV